MPTTESLHTYEVQGWKAGNVLHAAGLNAMDNQIAAVTRAILDDRNTMTIANTLTAQTLQVNTTSTLKGNSTIGGTLTVGTTSKNKDTTLNGNATITGNNTVGGTLTVGTAENNKDTTLNGNTTINGTATVSGALTAGGSETTSNIYGALKVTELNINDKSSISNAGFLTTKGLQVGQENATPSSSTFYGSIETTGNLTIGDSTKTTATSQFNGNVTINYLSTLQVRRIEVASSESEFNPYISIASPIQLFAPYFKMQKSADNGDLLKFNVNCVETTTETNCILELSKQNASSTVKSQITAEGKAEFSAYVKAPRVEAQSTGFYINNTAIIDGQRDLQNIHYVVGGLTYQGAASTGDVLSVKHYNNSNIEKVIADVASQENDSTIKPYIVIFADEIRLKNPEDPTQIVTLTYQNLVDLIPNDGGEST